MIERKSHAQKLLVLGVDGMDPRLTRKYVDAGKMPNVKKYIERGIAREDLVLLGGHPTITPPMWTTLATGCYANVHGITGFYKQHPTDLDAVTYALDSRDCKAEQIWNVTAESGLKTLVFHWPGSSWPPSSDSENLFVADGSSPGSIGMATSQVEKELILHGGKEVKTPMFVSNVDPNAVALCVIEELPDRPDEMFDANKSAGFLDRMSIYFGFDFSKMSRVKLDATQSPIKEAEGWGFAVPAGAKEFVMLLSEGLIHRNGLLLQNEDGIYDHVAIYKSKKDEEPIATLYLGQMQGGIIDSAFKHGETQVEAVRNMKLVKCEPDGSDFIIYISAAMDCNVDETWSPKNMYSYVKEVVGPTPPSGNTYDHDPVFHRCMHDCWDISMKWQAKAIHKIIETENIDVVFSHMHNVDMTSHTFINDMQGTGTTKYAIHDTEVYQQWMEDLYVQTDNYLGEFMHFLDEGWSVIITSDHAQVCPKNGSYWGLGQIIGLNVPLMEELGYMVLKRDENGERIEEIDYSKTRAVANRSNDIYINLKGRWPHGIVDPADQYELEEQIMTDLYGYKHPVTGKRVVALALRNKDAVLLGMGGPESGDIIYFLSEGYNWDHGDSLSTAWGEHDTSVSPIFIAAGPGFKSGEYTDRIIRQIDVAPTISALFGVRMPAQCEGAPAYQILDWEF